MLTADTVINTPPGSPAVLIIENGQLDLNGHALTISTPRDRSRATRAEVRPICFDSRLRVTFKSSVVAIWGNAGMYVVTLVTQKGGSGKSTLTVGLAVAAMEDANRVAVIEADSQGTVSTWRRRRTNPYPHVDRVADRVEIERAIPRLRAEGVRLAIIDTAATNNNLSSCAISVADFCLIPARPSPADIEAALPTLTTIRRFNRRFAFILNQTPPRGCRLSEAATALNSLGVLALPFIVQRNDYQDALGAGLGVTEFAPEGKASEEIRALWGWVSKQLNREAVVHG